MADMCRKVVQREGEGCKVPKLGQKIPEDKWTFLYLSWYSWILKKIIPHSKKLRNTGNINCWLFCLSVPGIGSFLRYYRYDTLLCITVHCSVAQLVILRKTIFQPITPQHYLKLSSCLNTIYVLQEINASEMLVAPSALVCYSLPWSAVVCFKCCWFGCCWLGCRWLAPPAMQDAGCRGMQTRHLPASPVHPSCMPCIPIAFPCIARTHLHPSASAYTPLFPPAPPCVCVCFLIFTGGIVMQAPPLDPYLGQYFFSPL